ncbi:MAG: hypothetical protein IKX47_04650, partial [Oscillospiraceae bacterium]|nr:hypothetical protein [Oscillospiraceae bacterium]
YGTYEKCKTYPEVYTVRSNGWTIIDEDSRYFVERPTEEAMRFLGFVNSRYYQYWFPEGAAETAEPAEEAEPAGDTGSETAEDPAPDGPLETLAPEP